MPQSLSNVLVHMVYSTKNRTPWLRDKEMRAELYAYKAAILRDNVDSPAILINGVEDHVHILLRLSRKFAIMKVVEEVKTEAAKWIKKQGMEYVDFHWQGGYGAFSVSPSNEVKAIRYIERQEDHHRRSTYQDEFLLLCQRHGV